MLTPFAQFGSLSGFTSHRSHTQLNVRNMPTAAPWTAPTGGALQQQRAAAPIARSCALSHATARLLRDERGALRGQAVHRNVEQLPEPGWKDDAITWRRPASLPRVTAPEGAPPIVLLPGFGNSTQDYTAPFGNEEAAIATQLQARGWRVYVVPIERKDWFKVARALVTLGFWRSGLTTHPGYCWYLDRVAATVRRAQEETGAQQVDLVGHSAGGWLARAFTGDLKYMPRHDAPPKAGIASDTPHPAVRSIVTLGSPQRPPPADKKRDMTGGAQGWVDRTFPGAHFKDAGVRYTCVIGRTVRGRREFPQTREGPRLQHEYAYDSYSEVCGEGQGLEGDCVVPLRSATLPGANTIVLDGVYHSMSRIGTFEEESSVVWYGSDSVIDAWLAELALPIASEANDDCVAEQALEEAAAETVYVAGSQPASEYSM